MNRIYIALLYFAFSIFAFSQTNHSDSIVELNRLISILEKDKNDTTKLNTLFQIHYYQQALIGELNEKNAKDFNTSYTKQGINLAIALQKYDTLKSLTVDLGYIFDLTKNFDSSFAYYSNCLNIFEATNNYQLTYSIAPNILYNNSQLQSVIEENNKQSIIQKRKIDTLTSAAIGVLLAFILFLIFFFIKSKRNNSQLKIQKEEIEKSKTEIDNSISYAQNIQGSILFNEHKLKEIFPESFVLFMPRDKVSGDFLWANRLGNQVYIAVADCTGHGVPGALLSIVGHFLFDAVLLGSNETSPAKILDHLHLEIVKSLNQHTNLNSHDGMDVGLLKICLDKNELTFAGAHRALQHVRDNKINTYKGTRKPIGGAQIEYKSNFEDTIIELVKGDTIYCYSDGYADQMGGEQKKKFMTKQLITLIGNNCNRSLADQKEQYKNTFLNYKGTHDQTDDVLMIGIKI
jgi:serine phosphatase RsbU (regulator of sigma subunit)